MADFLSNSASCERLARTVIYESHWVRLYRDRVKFPNGHIVEDYHLLEFDQAAAVAMVENAQGKVLMVRVYRYPTNSFQWEFPAGRVEKGETAEAAIRREVLEESGYQSSDLREIYSYHPVNGISNKIFHIFHGRAGEKTGEPDPNEVSDVRWADRGEIRSMIRAGAMRDGLSLLAFLMTEEMERCA
ncbi:MAG: NUDIX hydrolase [Candidatus Omnitrophica bacterium]|nr:NUDIX hydrolase [Candidatus Omnitrophota bacterium]